MKSPTVVLDKNVLVAALRSQKGASFRMLSLVRSSKYHICLSVPLVLEYEEVLLREIEKLNVNSEDVQDLIDYLCAVGRRQNVYFLWRPYLRDLEDDLVLELAVAAKCDYIVTFNQRDFGGIETFGILAITPKEFLPIIGELS